MKIIKRIFLTIVFLIVLVLIVALFVSKDCSVERQVTINKPKQDVFNYIKYIKNQDNFSVWNRKDPNMKKDYKGEDGTKGFIYSWDSDMKDVGKGEQEIADIKDGDSVNLNLHFIKPMDGRATAYMATSSAGGDSTTVKWGMHMKMPYPFNILRLFENIDDKIGSDLQTGLNNLKKEMEK